MSPPKTTHAAQNADSHAAGASPGAATDAPDEPQYTSAFSRTWKNDALTLSASDDDLVAGDAQWSPGSAARPTTRATSPGAVRPPAPGQHQRSHAVRLLETNPEFRRHAHRMRAADKGYVAADRSLLLPTLRTTAPREPRDPSTPAVASADPSAALSAVRLLVAPAEPLPGGAKVLVRFTHPRWLDLCAKDFLSKQQRWRRLRRSAFRSPLLAGAVLFCMVVLSLLAWQWPIWDMLLDMETDRHYHTLGLKPGAPSAEIKKAYRNAVREHHPDRNPGCGQQCADKMVELQEANDVLLAKGGEETRNQLQRDYHDALSQVIVFTFVRGVGMALAVATFLQYAVAAMIVAATAALARRFGPVAVAQRQLDTAEVNEKALSSGDYSRRAGRASGADGSNFPEDADAAALAVSNARGAVAAAAQAAAANGWARAAVAARAVQALVLVAFAFLSARHVSGIASSPLPAMLSVYRCVMMVREEDIGLKELAREELGGARAERRGRPVPNRAAALVSLLRAQSYDAFKAVLLVAGAPAVVHAAVFWFMEKYPRHDVYWFQLLFGVMYCVSHTVRCPPNFWTNWRAREATVPRSFLEMVQPPVGSRAPAALRPTVWGFLCTQGGLALDDVFAFAAGIPAPFRVAAVLCHLLLLCQLATLPWAPPIMGRAPKEVRLCRRALRRLRRKERIEREARAVSGAAAAGIGGLALAPARKLAAADARMASTWALLDGDGAGAAGAQLLGRSALGPASGDPLDVDGLVRAVAQQGGDSTDDDEPAGGAQSPGKELGGGDGVEADPVELLQGSGSAETAPAAGTLQTEDEKEAAGEASADAVLTAPPPVATAALRERLLAGIDVEAVRWLDQVAVHYGATPPQDRVSFQIWRHDAPREFDDGVDRRKAAAAAGFPTVSYDQSFCAATERAVRGFVATRWQRWFSSTTAWVFAFGAALYASLLAGWPGRLVASPPPGALRAWRDLNRNPVPNPYQMSAAWHLGSRLDMPPVDGKKTGAHHPAASVPLPAPGNGFALVPDMAFVAAARDRDRQRAQMATMYRRHREEWEQARAEERAEAAAQAQAAEEFKEKPWTPDGYKERPAGQKPRT